MNMILSDNLKPIITAGKQRLMAFVDNLEEQIDINLSQIQSLVPIANILAACESARFDSTPDELRLYITKTLGEEMPNIISRQFSGSTDAGNAFSIIIDKINNSNLAISIKAVNLSDDATTLVKDILKVVNGRIDSFISLSDRFQLNDEMISLQEILEMMQNSTTGMRIMSISARLYSEGQLTVSNLKSRIDATLDVVIDDLKGFLNIIVDNISFMTASYDNFIEFAKSIMSKIRSITTANDKFVYGVDTYEVNTSVFMGVDTVIHIASAVLGVVTTIFSPIVGVAVNLVGKAAGQIVQAIRENNNSTPIFPDDPSFVGFGQNSAKLYVYDKTNILYNAFVVKGAGIVTVQTPLTTAIIYNSPKKNSLNQDVYPCQEFIIPFVPTDPNIPTLAFNMIANGNSVQYTTSTSVIAGDSFYQGRLQVSGANQSSQSKRFNAYNEILQYVNNHPSSIHVINGSDSDAVSRFGVWYATMLYMYAIHTLQSEYSSLDATYSVMSAIDAHNTGNGEVISDLMTKQMLAAFCILNKTYALAINNRPYNAASSQSVSDWFEYMMTSNIVESVFITPILGLSAYVIRWSDLTNKYLGTESGYGSLIGYLDTSNVSAIPYSITNMDLADKLNPYMIPPQTEVNIWARIAVTIGSIAVTVATVAATRAVVKRKVQKSFYQNAVITKQSFQKWLDDPTDANWRAYIRDSRRTNLIGKAFGVGSFDAANNWINTPAAADGGLLGRLKALAGGDYSIKDVINLIKKI